MRRDREFYLQCIHERAVAEGGMVEHYYRVLSWEDDIQRYWWIAAASQIDIHIAHGLLQLGTTRFRKRHLRLGGSSQTKC